MTAPNVGVLLPTRAVLMQPRPPRDLESILTKAEVAEAAGYGSVWVGDSLLASPRPEALVTLAALAARTRRIGIGTAILIGSLRHPVHAAHQLATIDLISQGRLTVGVGFSSGTGPWKAEHDVVGVDVRTRRSRAIEGIEVMRALWAPGKASHRGRFFDIDDVELAPKPRRSGGPPVWIHGMRGMKTLERVARHGDGWINNLPTASEFAAGWRAVREGAAQLGRDPSLLTACHYSTVRVERDGAAARREGRRFMQTYYGGTDPDEIEHIECCIYGTPDACGQALARFVEAGARTLVLRLASHDQRGQLALISQHLLPLLRKMTVATLA